MLCYVCMYVMYVCNLSYPILSFLVLIYLFPNKLIPMICLKHVVPQPQGSGEHVRVLGHADAPRWGLAAKVRLAKTALACDFVEAKCLETGEKYGKKYGKWM